jgi:pantetheine-phosphate adenylyltransferase
VTTALVPGSFDPPTNGHVDVIARSASIFDRVVVGIVINPSKEPMFSTEERHRMLLESGEWDNVEVAGFEGLLVDFARAVDADVIVKGLRAMNDFVYEIQLAQMNRHLSGIDTMFMATRPDLAYLSSSLIKEVAGLGGSVESLVPDVVAKALTERFST